ncbi:conserved membrane hypothetical protein [Frankia canadensis]|uniref:Uncharacterized protein n=1 Tax=Frankia canadensis TaxID=1836972 RepID=A0A2I2KMU6_9ACTN|nr:hypothetical protein [Frankia canadensis]SNQ46988.1 conserved membrane hypothetical protein [Frankia canadensis]SOU54278.1 conserved membrane hypothetical protein [Frankia canadensis]
MTWGTSGRRWLMAGVVGAAVLLSSLGLLVVAVVPPFTSADEAEHTAYAVQIGHGSLPTLDTPMRSRLPGMPGLPSGCRASSAQARAAIETRARELCGVRLDRPLTNFDLIYTANHPPLFYAAESVPLRIGTGLDRPRGGFRAARALNVLFGVGLVVATAALARELLPRRPAVAVGAAGIIAVIGLVVTTSGQVYNDVLAMAMITGLLAAASALIRRGADWRAVSPCRCWRLGGGQPGERGGGARGGAARRRRGGRAGRGGAMVAAAGRRSRGGGCTPGGDNGCHWLVLPPQRPSLR